MYILYITLNYIQCYSLQLSCVQLAYDDVMYLHVAMAWSTPSPGRLWGILQQHIPISALLSMHWTVHCHARATCSCMLHFAPVKSNSPFLAKTSTRSPLSAELSHPSTLLYRWDSLRSSFLRFLLNSPSFLGPYGQTSFCPIDRQHHPPSKKRTGYRK